MTRTYEAVVIGSGFGGAITACRMAKKWPNDVLVIERGRRYPMGSFPRSPEEIAHSMWSVNLGECGAARPENRGMFELRSAGRMDAVVGAGLGGGSLVYSNVFLRPPPEVFADPRWPSSCTPATLEPYYAVAHAVLGARTVPVNDHERAVPRMQVFADTASGLCRTSTPTEVNVFFGTRDRLLPPGEEAPNDFGATQTSCTYCGECNIGCNLHAKNTLDLNYLYQAEHAYGARILTDHLVTTVTPLDRDGRPDQACDGTSGYLVACRNLDTGKTVEVRTARVVVAAGALGTVELLLRARDVERTLTRLPDSLGKGFSGNGDFLMFVAGIDTRTEPSRGPVITQYIDHGLFADPRPNGFMVQDSGYPNLLAWYVEGAKPRLLAVPGLIRAGGRAFARRVQGRSGGAVGSSISALLQRGVSNGSAVLLCMGRDSSNGRLFLKRRRLTGRTHLTGRWPLWRNRALYHSITAAGEAFRDAAEGADVHFNMPTWLFPFRRNITVHALGGCRLADSKRTGVVSADPARFGQVFGYENLYVADGSIVPTAVGANPTATISALAELVAEGITGIEPTANL